VKNFFDLSLPPFQAGMHIYSRASAKGKRVQVSLHLTGIFLHFAL
jgi:hypothetical protein